MQGPSIPKPNLAFRTGNYLNSQKDDGCKSERSYKNTAQYSCHYQQWRKSTSNVFAGPKRPRKSRS